LAVYFANDRSEAKKNYVAMILCRCVSAGVLFASGLQNKLMGSGVAVRGGSKAGEGESVIDAPSIAKR
jgi:hypothetical protein